MSYKSYWADFGKQRTINPDWDKAFLDGLTRDPDGLARIPPIDHVREAGSEGIEMVMWLIMRGALDATASITYQPRALP